MRFSILVVAVVTATATAPAHAEFVLLATPVAEASANVTRLPMTSTRSKPKPSTRTKRPASDPAVMGFGDQIPLSFAVRQIVPTRFQVAFGEEVDRERRVDWRGGKPWQSALSEALKPVGLTIDVHGLTVTIVEADAIR